MAQKYVDIKLVNESSKEIPEEVIKMSQESDFTFNDAYDELEAWNLKVKSVEIECLDECCNKSKLTITIGDR